MLEARKTDDWGQEWALEQCLGRGCRGSRKLKTLIGSLLHPRSFPSVEEPKRASKLSSIPGSPKANMPYEYLPKYQLLPSLNIGMLVCLFIPLVAAYQAGPPAQ